jgi:hypothetical protein
MCSINDGLAYSKRWKRCYNLTYFQTASNGVIHVNTTTQQRFSAWAGQTIPTVLEWVPKIYEYLYNREQPYPVTSIEISVGSNLTKNGNSYHVTLGSILIEADYLSQFDLKDPGFIIPFLVDSLREPNLTVSAPKWIINGISNYMRYYVYDAEPPTVKITSTMSYDSSPLVTASFFSWIDLTRKMSIVVALNQMVNDRVFFTDVLWIKVFGKTLDALWQEYLDSFTINL